MAAHRARGWTRETGAGKELPVPPGTRTESTPGQHRGTVVDSRVPRPGQIVTRTFPTGLAGHRTLLSQAGRRSVLAARHAPSFSPPRESGWPGTKRRPRPRSKGEAPRSSRNRGCTATRTPARKARRDQDGPVRPKVQAHRIDGAHSVSLVVSIASVAGQRIPAESSPRLTMRVTMRVLFCDRHRKGV